MPWNPPYYRQYLETAGYRPSYPFWIYEIDFDSERYRQVSELALASPGCEMRPIDKRRWNGEIETIRELFNAGMSDEWEMH